MMQFRNWSPLAALLVSLGLSSSIQADQSPPVDAKVKTSCESDPRVVKACFWKRGSIFIGNGNPAARLKVRGTSLYYGIKDDENPILPDNVKLLLTTENNVSGEFLFCPFSTPKKNTLQVGCIAKANHVSVQP
jgi:hypothetical protein